MKEKKQLTKVETQVMNVLWNLQADEVVSAEIMDAFPEPKPAMTTLLTFLKRLTEKGFVRTDRASCCASRPSSVEMTIPTSILLTQKTRSSAVRPHR